MYKYIDACIAILAASGGVARKCCWHAAAWGPTTKRVDVERYMSTDVDWGTTSSRACVRDELLRLW